MLPSIIESARIAHFHVRSALGLHGLSQYADDDASITSELVANMVKHVCCDIEETIGITLARAWDQDAVIIAVSRLLAARPGDAQATSRTASLAEDSRS